MEEADNPAGVDVLLGTENPEATEREICGSQIAALVGTCADGKEFTAVPYYIWCNREKGKMNVWLRQEGKEGSGNLSAADAEGYAAHQTGSWGAVTEMSKWEGRLYRRYQ